jgi:signal transduction histidine kinase
MQPTEQTGWGGGAERKRVEAVVETLAAVRGEGENLAEIAHDARNMVTALGLYCDLLEEPGVLAAPYIHYGKELRLVAAASRRLVEKLVALDTLAGSQLGSHFGSQVGLLAAAVRPAGRQHAEPHAIEASAPNLRRADASQLTNLSPHDPGKRPVQSAPERRARASQRWDLLPALPLENLASELLANRNLLAALAGPTVALTVETDGGSLPVRLTGEDLTRVLVNLVKNAAEAMPSGGKIHLRLHERTGSQATEKTLALTVEDTGPGISPRDLDKVFEAGFSTQAQSSGENGWPATHRGLGLSITRSIIESAGGHITALNRERAGGCFQIEMPVRSR